MKLARLLKISKWSKKKKAEYYIISCLILLLNHIKKWQIWKTLEAAKTNIDKILSSLENFNMRSRLRSMSDMIDAMGLRRQGEFANHISQNLAKINVETGQGVLLMTLSGGDTSSVWVHVVQVHWCCG
ncbi:hypothetical protein CEXT_278091 [Caerostris extrusa]|uniref:Uncharacterized protein n=1 Tax=Caerostris extrusa TaxID=172846 RepID=A0AAV4SBB1_CAEEX|nr:hypothetical protein CEXT_278091 [Caerostris extrusa]